MNKTKKNLFRRRKAMLSISYRQRKLGLERLEDRVVLNAQMVLDINRIGPGETPQPFAEINGIAYFVAKNNVFGSELWRSDGTAHGTYIVKDIFEGAGSSNPMHLTNVDGTLFFSANDGINGRELWKSDGTSNGTVLVTNINNTGSSSPESLFNLNGELFFTAFEPNNGRELWKSDGMEAGTARVKDIFAGNGSSMPGDLANVNGVLYFSATGSNNRRELWRSDGSEEGTFLFRGNPGSRPSYPQQLTNVGGTLFFTVKPSNSVFGRELWKSDGTGQGTQRVMQNNDGVIYFDNHALFDVNGELIFTVWTTPMVGAGVGSIELWKTNGTTEGTLRLRSLGVGNANNAVSPLVVVNERAFFSVGSNFTQVRELYTSDGTVAGTFPVVSGSNLPSELTNVNGSLLFVSGSAANRELWTSNGTSQGTRQVRDVFPAGSSSPHNLTNVNGSLFFSAYDGGAERSLWKSDGTFAGTTKIANVAVSQNGSSNPINLVNVGGSLLFASREGGSVHHLWKSSGLDENTSKLSVATWIDCCTWEDYATVNNVLFFRGRSQGIGSELWRSDGTADGTALVADIFKGGLSSSPQNLTNVGGTLFFTANDGNFGVELWKTDGTEHGTTIVKDIRDGLAPSFPRELVDVNGTLFFYTTDSVGETTSWDGGELWKSDGTSEGTVLVKDIAPGPQPSIGGNLTNVDGTLYFRADNGQDGFQLWRSDGSEAGTFMVKKLNPNGSALYRTGLVNVGGTLFFKATDGDYRTGLWITDGSSEGTKLLRGFRNGQEGSNITHMTEVSGQLFFRANNGSSGYELWVSDGTIPGTRLVKDIVSGAAGSSPDNFTNINGLLFFTATTPEDGTELWRSDGTVDGTFIVQDILEGTGGSAPQRLTNVNGSLFFAADDGFAGRELWVATADLVVTDVSLPQNAIAGVPFDYSWTIMNQGAVPVVGTWSDKVFVSENGKLTDSVIVGEVSYSGTLMPGESITRVQSYSTPIDTDGEFRFFVHTDHAQQIFEHLSIENNISASLSPVKIGTADLRIAEFDAPEIAILGEAIATSWQVQHVGSAYQIDGWFDQIWLATDAVRSGNDIPLIANLIAPPKDALPLAAGETYTLVSVIQLPSAEALPAGEYFLIVQTNATEIVPESNKDNNTLAIPITLKLPPVPDLVVGPIVPPEFAVPGQSTSVSWTVANIGDAAANGPWIERVYLSNDAAGTNRQLLGSFTRFGVLEAGADPVQRTETVAIPQFSLNGDVYFLVEVDAGNAVVESDEQNLFASDTTLNIQAVLGLGFTTSTLNESGPGAQGVITRNGDAQAPLTVNLSASPNGRLVLPASVTIPAGQFSQRFNFSALDDTLYHEATTVVVTASASGFPAVSRGIEVIDNDLPILSLSLSQTVLAEGDSIEVTVTRNFVSNQARVLTIVVDNPQQLSAPASVILLAGQSSVTFTLQAINDLLIEPTRTHVISVAAAGNVGDSATVTILASDIPALGLDLPTSLPEGAQGPSILGRVTRDPATSIAVDVQLSSSDPSQLVVPAIVRIPAGQASVFFPIQVGDDQVVNGDRSIQVTARMLPSAGGPAIQESAVNQSITILDNDGLALSVSFDRASVAEGFTAVANIRRNSVNVSQPVTVNLSATPAGHLSFPASVVIPAGATSVNVNVLGVEDGITDGDQIVSLNATASDHLMGSGTIIVTDVNLPDLDVISLQPSKLTATTGELLDVSWVIANSGNAVALGTWTQRIFISFDALIGNDVLAGQYTYSGPLAPGDSYDRTVGVRMPTQPGNYWLVLFADVNGVVDELLESNNTRITAVPVMVTAAYTATASTEVVSAPANTPVLITGTATRLDRTPAAFSQVNVHLAVRGTRRVFPAVTDATGNYSLTFNPLPGEGGRYTIGAAHPGESVAPVQDEFLLVGMRAEPPAQSISVREGGPAVSGSLTIRNLADVPLTGLSLEIVGAPGNIAVTAQIRDGATSISELGTVIVDYTVAALDASIRNPNFQLRINTLEAPSVSFPVSVTVVPLVSRLVADKARLDAGMLVGSQTSVEFMVTNDGGIATGPLQVLLPSGANWLTLATPANMRSLAPGESASVTLLLTPPQALELTAYNGSLIVRGSDSEIVMPFTFKEISTEVGVLQLSITDEIYYLSENPTLLVDVSLVLRESQTGDTVLTYSNLQMQSFTQPGEMHLSEIPFVAIDENNRIIISNLKSGAYQIEINSDSHYQYVQPVKVDPGITNSFEAFILRETVRYSWTVVPTSLEDQVSVVLNATFESNLPMPVVSVAFENNDFRMQGKPTFQVNVIVENHGLLAANGVKLSIPEHPDFVFLPLIEEIGTVAAKARLTIPVIVRHKYFDEQPEGVTEFLISARNLFPDKFIDGLVLNSGNGGNITPDFRYRIDVPDKYRHCVRDAVVGAIQDLLSDASLVHLRWRYFLGNVRWDSITVLMGDPGTGNNGRYFHDKQTIVIRPEFVHEACECAKTDDQKLEINKARELLEAMIAHETIHFIDVEDGRPYYDNPGFCAVGEAGFDWERAVYGDCKGSNVQGQPNVPYRFRPEDCEIEVIVYHFFDCGPFSHAKRAHAETSKVSWSECCILTSLPQAPTGVFAVTRKDGSAKPTLTQFKSPKLLRPEPGQCNTLTNRISVDYSAQNQQIQGENNLSNLDVCSLVGFRLSSTTILSRDAFWAELEIVNDTSAGIDQIEIEIEILDSLGTSARDLFTIVLQNIQGIEGSGQNLVLPSARSGKLQWLLVPSKVAALTGSTVYSVGGEIRYRANGVLNRIDLMDVIMTVFPQPELYVTYFLQRDVIGNDPHTPGVEPSQPFTLAVMARNDGAGIARNLRIESAQPRIVENEKGLLVDFEITGTRVNGQELNPTLTALLGNVGPGELAIAEWEMLSTLQGLFIGYNATFEHLSGLGDNRFSLIKDVQIRELIRTVNAAQVNGDDGLPDFLVNDLPDPQALPDTLYLSDGTVAEVSLGSNAIPASVPSVSNLRIDVTAQMGAGWSYIRMDDPSFGNFVLLAVERSDGTSLPVKNFWQTDRTFVGGGLRPVLENKIHLLDYNSTGSYTFAFSNGDLVGPELVAFSGVTPNPTTQTINVVDIQFNEPLNLATLTPEALSLTKNGIAVATLGLAIASVGNNTYRVSGLGAFTAEDAVYELFLDLSQVTDQVGNPGSGMESYRWVRGETSPTILSLSGVPSGFTNQIVDFIDVVFSKPIVPASFGPEDVSLLRDGSEVLDTQVTIVQLGPTTYRIGNLARLIGNDGVYRLTVNAAGVQDTVGAAGIGDSVANWTLDATPPVLVTLFDPPTNPRNIVVQQIDVQFSEPIDVSTFNVGDLILVRDGGTENLLAGDPRVTIEDRGNNRYRIGGINWVQAFVADPQVATFTLTVDASGIRDLVGNSGVGVLSSTWTIDLDRPLPATELQLYTFSGPVSAGRLNSRFATLTGRTLEPGLTISVLDTTTNRELVRQKLPGTMFSLPIEFPSAGQHGLRVRVIDEAGNTGDAWLENLFIEEIAPLLEAVEGISQNFTSTRVDNLLLRFVTPIQPASFTTAAISLRRNSGEELINSEVVLTPQPDGRTFVLSGLQQLTEAEGFYDLRLDLAAVVSLSGLNGSGQIQWNWIVDTIAPQSQIEPLAAVQNRTTFVIRAQGFDPSISATLSGSGIVSYDIYVALNDGDFVLYQTVPVDNASTTFTGQPNSRYRFYSRARDAAGNIEAVPSVADTETLVQETSTLAAIIGDRVWLDRNANGIQDPDEIGVQGVIVRIYESSSESPFLQTVSDETGLYSFADLDATKLYFLEFVSPAGLGFSPQNVGTNDALDSDVDIVSGRTPIFGVTGGENFSWDAGLIELGVLSGIVWRDANGDGMFGVREVVLPGQTVYIDINNNGQLDSDEPTAVTDDLGRYTFPNVRPGQVVVRQVIPEGWEQTFPGIAGASSIAGPSSLSFTGSSIVMQSPAVDSLVRLDQHLISLRTDINGDGITSPLDVLLIINFLNRAGESTDQPTIPSSPFAAPQTLTTWGDPHDVNSDGTIDQTDIADLIAWLNATGEMQLLSGTSGSPAGQSQAQRLIGLDELKADQRFAHLDGRGLSVVVIDTGLDLDHPFFGPSTNGQANRIVYSYDFADQDPNVSDYSGHGTHVTSIIASADSRYPGVAPGVDIIHLKVFQNNGYGAFSYLENALQWVAQNVANYAIGAVNLSLGDGGNWTEVVSRYGLGDELQMLDALGVITVASAGNSFAIHDSRPGLAYPAADPYTISVGAVWDANYGRQSAGNFGIDYTTDADRITSFSQRHDQTLDILAPGALITGAFLNGGVATMRGTSMSAPFVTGAAVLMQQLALEHHGIRLTNAQFRELLTASADMIVDGDDEDDNVRNTGANFGRLNLWSLANQLLANGLPASDGDDRGGDRADESSGLGASGGAHGYTINLGPGQARDNLDFGMRPIDTTPPQVNAVRIGGETSQRSMIRSIEYRFDSQVVIQEGAFVLTRQGVPVPLTIDEQIVDDRTVVRLTFTPSEHTDGNGTLVDGRYRLTALESHITDLSGNRLDGAGDGSVGSDRVDDFFRFFGDHDGDGDVDLTDFAFFRRALGKQAPDPAYNEAFDFDSDGDVDLTDLAFFRRNLDKSLP